jgi:hypothetical protein
MPTSDERSILVRSFPATDKDFADATGDELAKAVAAQADPLTLHEVVEERLRSAYRNARIRVQDELGHLGSQEIIWYAYRDGRIRESDARRERLYSVVADARRTVREAEAVLGRARAVSRAAGFGEIEGPLPEDVIPIRRAPRRGADRGSPRPPSQPRD